MELHYRQSLPRRLKLPVSGLDRRPSTLNLPRIFNWLEKHWFGTGFA
jgi:hypothetical protein